MDQSARSHKISENWVDHIERLYNFQPHWGHITHGLFSNDEEEFLPWMNLLFTKIMDSVG